VFLQLLAQGLYAGGTAVVLLLTLISTVAPAAFTGPAPGTTNVFAPGPTGPAGLGLVVLLAGGLTLYLGPGWAVVMMGLVFGLGHIALGAALLVAERRQNAVRLYRSVA
jgi:hypothetical protein